MHVSCGTSKNLVSLLFVVYVDTLTGTLRRKGEGQSPCKRRESRFECPVQVRESNVG